MSEALLAEVIWHAAVMGAMFLMGYGIGLIHGRKGPPD
jgi:hypothetical protein